MNKFLKRAVSIMCAAVLALGFSGCGLSKNNNAVTAYEIAVKNGFVGTEAEWLESLKGANGDDAEQYDIKQLYEAAKTEGGFDGSFLDFLKEYLQIGLVENNDTETIAENVLSVVKVNCGFKKTVSGLGGWMGGFITQEEVYASGGSGVIVDVNKEAGNALILTNYHVIYDSECNTSNHISDEIYVYPYGAISAFSTATGKDEGGDGIKVRYVGGAMDYDIAILAIEGSEYIKKHEVRAAKIGDSEKVQVGEEVFIIGNPGNYGISVTGGIVSVYSEYIKMAAIDGKNREVLYRVIRTDAAINAGNSGGGLFNAYGELIGIANARSAREDVQSICYALPITSVAYLCDNILDNGGVLKKATLGIVSQITGSEASLSNGILELKETSVITQVTEGALAYGKLKVGDVLQSITIKGEKIQLKRRYQFNDMLLNVRMGESIVISVLRDGSIVDVPLTFDKDSHFTTMS